MNKYLVSIYYFYDYYRTYYYYVVARSPKQAEFFIRSHFGYKRVGVREIRIVCSVEDKSLLGTIEESLI